MWLDVVDKVLARRGTQRRDARLRLPASSLALLPSPLRPPWWKERLTGQSRVGLLSKPRPSQNNHRPTLKQGREPAQLSGAP